MKSPKFWETQDQPWRGSLNLFCSKEKEEERPWERGSKYLCLSYDKTLVRGIFLVCTFRSILFENKTVTCCFIKQFSMMKLFFCLTPTLPLATMKFNPQLLISAQSKVQLLCHDIFIPTDWNKVEKYVNIKIWYNFCKLLAQQTNMLCTFFNIRVSPTTKFLQLLGLIKISPQSFKMSLYNAIALFLVCIVIKKKIFWVTTITPKINKCKIWPVTFELKNSSSWPC